MKKKLRGFATFSPEKLRAICSRGGKSSHAQGLGHTFTSAEASAAALKAHANGNCHKFTREEARLAGRKGGLARAARRAEP